MILTTEHLHFVILQDEEGKLLTRLEEHTYLNSNAVCPTSQNVKRGEQLSGSDIILCKLFFSPKLTALSPGIQFDPSIRYLLCIIIFIQFVLNYELMTIFVLNFTYYQLIQDNFVVTIANLGTLLIIVEAD